MIDYIDMHQPGFWVAVGFALLAAEVLLFGFTTIILLFAGIGALVTGLAMMSGLLPETCFGIATGAAGAVLWKPLKKLQDHKVPKRQHTSDLIGYEFVLKQDVTALASGLHRYSGVDWRVEPEAGADEQLSAGQRVAVTSVDAGLFRVKVAR